MATAADTPEDVILGLNRDASRIDAETRKLTAETDKLKAEAEKFLAKNSKLGAESLKLAREATKLEPDRMLSPWLILAQGLIAGAALMGAGVALAKLLIG